MRSQKQRAKRLDRVRLANEILAWLQGREEKEGLYSYASVIGPFARHKGFLKHFEIWKAWDILKEAGRRPALPGPVWRIDSFEPIDANEDGDIIRVPSGQ